jgi:hypothetical protein
VDGGDGEVASAPVLVEVLVTTDPLVLPDALGRRPGAGIGVVSSWIAFSVLPPSCAALQSAALQFFFLY